MALIALYECDEPYKTTNGELVDPSTNPSRTESVNLVR
jgi:hypothetical protein